MRKNIQKILQISVASITLLQIPVNKESIRVVTLRGSSLLLILPAKYLQEKYTSAFVV